MIRLRRNLRLLTLLLGIGALILLPGAAARANHFTVNLTEPVTFDGSLYSYNYAVTNDTADSVYYVVSLTVLPMADAIEAGSLVAPEGFQIAFDPGLGIVDLLADERAFDPGFAIPGFQFKSRYAPGTSTFEALGLAGDDENAVIASGTFVGPVVIPEPGTLALAALPAGLFVLRLRSRGRFHPRGDVPSQKG
jgi:hypothetical protein